jgi:hypothetical protein
MIIKHPRYLNNTHLRFPHRTYVDNDGYHGIGSYFNDDTRKMSYQDKFDETDSLHQLQNERLDKIEDIERSLRVNDVSEYVQNTTDLDRLSVSPYSDYNRSIPRK